MVGGAEDQIAIRKGGCACYLPVVACHLPVVRVGGLWLVGDAEGQIATRKGGCACHLPVVRVGGLWLGTLRVRWPYARVWTLRVS